MSRSSHHVVPSGDLGKHKLRRWVPGPSGPDSCLIEARESKRDREIKHVDNTFTRDLEQSRPDPSREL